MTWPSSRPTHLSFLDVVLEKLELPVIFDVVFAIELDGDGVGKPPRW